MKYQNRYNDTFTFTKDTDGNVLWEGEFKHCRFSWPNVYDDAYAEYIQDGSPYGVMDFEEFKNKVHEYDHSKYFMEDRKYAELVYSDKNKIAMVDPSGGPYISAGFSLDHISEEFEGMIVEGFEVIPTGYKILIKNESKGTDTKRST